MGEGRAEEGAGVTAFNWWIPLLLCAAMIGLGIWIGWMLRGIALDR